MTAKETLRCSYWFNFLYIFVIQGIGSGVVGGGIEFAIAYGMYWNSEFPVMLWAFPNTLSGDCALSLFIQVGVTWALMEIFIGLDCFKSRSPVIPFSLPLPDKQKHRIVWYYFEIEHGISKEGENDVKAYLKRQFIRYPDRSLPYNIIYWLFWKFVVSMTAAIGFWTVVWPVTMGILAGIGRKVGSHDYMFHGWEPQVTKLIYAFVLGFLTSPSAIIVILIRDKWYMDYSAQRNSKSLYDEKIDMGNSEEQLPSNEQGSDSGPSSNSRKSHHMHLPPV
ncbi:hypothetical protein HG535_0H03910 [Zygotorulaspora mrakii]|uniref:Uncharacterized protein n=1 Tax=Zygotorulaspora mrakii TaxID=42260 RepID=A0A7H9B9T2_ZYGMR|nr:uncharacterized protein HG535_0H03910 [Zygotorulaspora mrakii]QLG75064.1 hypothetical protein HG535_0H03910 [Zygotorulaspora mrakii]